MHEYTWTQLFKDNPEWATVLLAAITTLIIFWQVVVMIWQGKRGDERDRQQNELLRLQFHHSWLTRMNAEREKILRLTKDIHSAAGCLTLPPMTGGESFWENLGDKTDQMRDCLSILDFGACHGDYDSWFPLLEDYIEDLRKIIVEDYEFQRLYKLDGKTPVAATRTKLKEAEARHSPIGICLDIETAIRMEFFEFKQNFDDEMKARVPRRWWRDAIAKLRRLGRTDVSD